MVTTGTVAKGLQLFKSLLYMIFFCGIFYAIFHQNKSEHTDLKSVIKLDFAVVGRVEKKQSDLEAVITQLSDSNAHLAHLLEQQEQLQEQQNARQQMQLEEALQLGLLRNAETQSKVSDPKTPEDDLEVRGATGNSQSHKQQQISTDNRKSPSGHVGKCGVGSRQQHLNATYRQSCSTTWTPHNLHTMTDRQLKDLVRNIHVDNQHNVLFCEVPKAGSTSYKYLFVKYSKIFKDAMLDSNGTLLRKKKPSILAFDWQKFGIRSLFTYSRPQILSMLSKYTKVISVRHPLARMHSVFADKLHDRQMDCNKTDYFSRIGLEIMKQMRDKSQMANSSCAYDLTFKEFATYASLHTSFLQRDRHLKPYTTLCHPCAVHYDYLLKLETGDSDQQLFITDILKEVPGSNSIHLNVHASTSENKWIQNNFSGHIKDFDDIDTSVIDNLKSFYAKDMEMFGYSVSQYINKLEIDCRVPCSTGYCC